MIEEWLALRTVSYKIVIINPFMFGENSLVGRFQ